MPFHITKAGEPARCGATTRACPLGGTHYDSMEEASLASFDHFLATQTEVTAAPTAPTPDDDLEVPLDEWQEGSIRVRPLDDPAIFEGPNRAVLPPGRYFLGDPCYTAGRDDTAWQQWVDVADATSEGMTHPVIGGTYNDQPVIASSTAYGDGEYYGSNGVSYPVDAGLIGVVPEAVIRGMKLTDADLEGSGSWVDVDRPTPLEFDASDGTIFFGPVAIHTGDRLCERCGGQVAEDDWCESCDDHHCEQCGSQLNNPYDSWCGSCADDEFEED